LRHRQTAVSSAVQWALMKQATEAADQAEREAEQARHERLAAALSEGLEGVDARHGGGLLGMFKAGLNRLRRRS